MKNWIKPSKIEWVSFIIMMPLVAALLNLILFGKRIWTDDRIWLYSFPLINLQGLVSWYIHIAAMHWYRIKFPALKQTGLRLTILGITHIFLTSLTFASIFYIYDLFHFLGFVIDVDKFKVSLLLAIALNMVATSMWEADYTLNQWKASVAEKEKLEQLTLQYEFETLKSQINPHFLFNCFNTLSSLIAVDKIKAEEFLNELSRVYRYLLRTNKNGLSTLENEIQFVQSYSTLLKTRHGEALQLEIEIDKRYNQYLLPSLSLQLLIENAVKHNVVTKSSPLAVDIFTATGNVLVVNNNLQLKQYKPISNGIGLENIRSKYELLQQSGFQVLKDEKNFSVVLPLIWSPVMEQQISLLNTPATNKV